MNENEYFTLVHDDINIIQDGDEYYNDHLKEWRKMRGYVGKLTGLPSLDGLRLRRPWRKKNCNKTLSKITNKQVDTLCICPTFQVVNFGCKCGGT